MAANMKIFFFLASFTLLQDFSQAESTKQHIDMLPEESVAQEAAVKLVGDYKTKIPLVSQEISQTSGPVDFTIEKVLTCQEAGNLKQQKVSQNNGPNIENLPDPLYQEYMQKYGSKFTKFINRDNSRNENTMVKQNISQSRDAKKQQTVNLIIDCPQWCTIPIEFQQSFVQSSAIASQTITARFICEKERQPKITVTQDKKCEQVVETYVAYTDSPKDGESERQTIDKEKQVTDTSSTQLEEGEDFDFDDFEEEESEAALPSVSHVMRNIDVGGTVSYVKVIRCYESGTTVKTVSNVKRGSLWQFNENDNTSSDYLKSPNYSRQQIWYKTGKPGESNNPVLTETIERCSRALTQYVRLILDCEAWCKEPVTINQSVQSRTVRITQYAEINMVCSAGDKPTIVVNQNKKAQRNITQKLNAYVLYRK